MRRAASFNSGNGLRLCALSGLRIPRSNRPRGSQARRASAYPLASTAEDVDRGLRSVDAVEAAGPCGLGGLRMVDAQAKE